MDLRLRAILNLHLFEKKGHDIYICVCVCVCTYVRMYVLMYVCSVCMHACIYILKVCKKNVPQTHC